MGLRVYWHCPLSRGSEAMAAILILSIYNCNKSLLFSVKCLYTWYMYIHISFLGPRIYWHSWLLVFMCDRKIIYDGRVPVANPGSVDRGGGGGRPGFWVIFSQLRGIFQVFGENKGDARPLDPPLVFS